MGGGGETVRVIFTYCSEFFWKLARLSFSFWKSRYCTVKQTHNRALPLWRENKQDTCKCTVHRIKLSVSHIAKHDMAGRGAEERKT